MRGLLGARGRRTLLLAAALFLGLGASSAFGTPSSADLLAKEVQLGRHTAEEIEKTWPRVADPVQTARLEMLLQRLQPYLTRPLPYEMRLVDRKEPNAFALPGGICYVTRGMLEFVRSDPELAAVVAHELIHADRRHGVIQMARNERMTLLALAVAVASRGHAAALLLSNIAQVAVMNSYSRDLEREADSGALDLLLKTGYDPAGMVTLLERLSEEHLKRPNVDPGVYQDHPDLPERIQYVEGVLKARKIPLERKRVLGLLRLQMEHREDRWVLLVDQRPWTSRPEGPGAREFLEETARRLEEDYQLELAPHEILVSREGSGDFLLVGGRRILSARDLPRGESLDSLRETLVESLLEAQKKHPMGRFLR